MPRVDTFSFIIWIATAIAYASLAIAIALRSGLRRWFSLFLFAAVSSSAAIALFFIYRAGSSVAYFWGYWGERFVLGACQFGIIWQVAGSLLVARRWRRRACKAMLIFTFLALAGSGAMTLATPLPIYAAVMRIVVSIDRCMSLASCILFVLTTLSFDAMGLRWRREALLIGIGLSIQGALFTSF